MVRQVWMRIKNQGLNTGKTGIGTKAEEKK